MREVLTFADLDESDESDGDEENAQPHRIALPLYQPPAVQRAAEEERSPARSRSHGVYTYFDKNLGELVTARAEKLEAPPPVVIAIPTPSPSPPQRAGSYGGLDEELSGSACESLILEPPPPRAEPVYPPSRAALSARRRASATSRPARRPARQPRLPALLFSLGKVAVIGALGFVAAPLVSSGAKAVQRAAERTAARIQDAQPPPRLHAPASTRARTPVPAASAAATGVTKWQRLPAAPQREVRWQPHVGLGRG